MGCDAFPPTNHIPLLHVDSQKYELEIERGKRQLTPKELDDLEGRVVVVRGNLVLRPDKRRPLVLTSISKPGKGE